MDLEDLETALQGATGTAIWVLLVAIAALIVVRLSRGWIRALLERRMARSEGASRASREDAQRRLATLVALVEWILRVLVLGAATLVILTALNLTVVLAAVVVAFLVVALVARDVIRDYVAGAIAIVENHYAIGDYVTVADQTGDVESLSLRRTVLRSDEGDLISVPNGEIRIARNWTRTWARVNLELAISDPARVDDAVAAIAEAGRAMSADPAHAGALLEPPAFLGVAGFDDTGVRLLVRGRIRAADRLQTEGEYRRRLLEALLARGLRPSLARHVTLTEPLTEPVPAPASAPTDAPSAEG